MKQNVILILLYAYCVYFYHQNPPNTFQNEVWNLYMCSLYSDQSQERLLVGPIRVRGWIKPRRNVIFVIQNTVIFDIYPLKMIDAKENMLH